MRFAPKAAGAAGQSAPRGVPPVFLKGLPYSISEFADKINSFVKNFPYCTLPYGSV